MLKINGYDKGGNIKAEINGLPYKFATAEFYGQVKKPKSFIELFPNK